MSKMTASDVEALIELFERSDWDTLQLEIAGFRLDLGKRGCHAAGPAGMLAGAALAPVSSPAPTPTSTFHAASAAAPAEPARTHAVPKGWFTVRAPNLGTFYCAPKPGAPPYVEVGQQVRADTEICLLEVMKLFTAVAAGVEGIVREICVADGDMVEYDQPLLLIEPHA